MPDISLLQLILIAATAFFASIIGGLAGYGTGLLLPLVLVPIVGAKAAVPVMAVAALFTNASRAIASRELIDWKTTLIALPAALVMTTLAARMFSGFDNRTAAIVIGCVLICLVPLRRILKRAGFKLNSYGVAAGGAVYGFVTGSSTGAGVILVSILMAAGLSGMAVVATDAAISVAIGLTKIAAFQAFGVMTGALLVFGALVGLTTVPGAFLAKRLAEKLGPRIHTRLLDAVVVIGGAMMIWRAL